MDPDLVTVPISNEHEQFLKGIEKRRKTLAMDLCEKPDEKEMRQVDGNEPTGDNNDDDDDGMETDLMPFGNYETKFTSILTGNSGPRQLDFLLVLVANQWQLWNSLVEPNPCGYLDEISSLEKLIRSPRNILGMAGQFKEREPGSWDKQRFLERCEHFGCCCPDIWDFVIIDRLLIVELTKALPFFKQLDLNDQIALLRHVVHPASILINAYYSFAMGARTWTRTNGLTFITLYQHHKQYRDNKAICKLNRRFLYDSITAIRDCSLDNQEFVLSLIILCCTSNAPNLSETAKDLLYNESVQLSRNLFELCKQKHGAGGGAARFAECMHLLASMHTYVNVMDNLHIHIDLLNLQSPSTFKYNIPRALAALF